MERRLPKRHFALWAFMMRMVFGQMALYCFKMDMMEEKRKYSVPFFQDLQKAVSEL